MIIFDENIEDYWIQLIKSKEYEYFSIRENCPGISDKKVIEIARNQEGIIVNEDKDFGELLFYHGVDKVSVLFMRYDQPHYHQIERYFLKCIDDYLSNKEACFIIISRNKVRYRRM